MVFCLKTVIKQNTVILLLNFPMVYEINPEKLKIFRCPSEINVDYKIMK